MKKTDKKIISIFLVLIILILQFSPILATEKNISGMLTLEQYLIDNGVDQNGDEIISDEEWKSVKNLNLQGNCVDITGIEKAVNLKKLHITCGNLKGIKFANLKNLKELRLQGCLLDNAEISNLDNLESLLIYNSVLNSCKIENLENLENVTLYECNIEGVDFSKIKNVKEMYIYIPEYLRMNKVDLDFTVCKNLESLIIFDVDPYEYDYDKNEFIYKDLSRIRSLNISGLSNLKELYLTNTYDCNIEFLGLNNIENIYIDSDKIEEIDFTKYEKLKKVGITQTREILHKEKIKISEDFIALAADIYGSGYYYIDLEKKENVVEMIKNGIIYTGEQWGDSIIAPIESNILEFDFEKWQIIAKNVGEQKIKLLDPLEREHEILIRVFENNISTELDNFGITAKEIDYNRILKSNGELWKITSGTTSQMIDTNVKKYISNRIYEENYVADTVYEDYYNRVINTLYKDNKLVVEYLEGNKKTIENVKDIGETLYVTTDGKLYEYEFEYVTEEFKEEYIMDNVKNIVNQQFIILENGKTLEKIGIGEYTELFDFEIKDYKSWVWNDLKNGGQWVDIVIDVNDNKFIYSDNTLREINENDNLIDENYENSGYYLALSKNKTAHLTYGEYEEENILNAPLILTDVEYISPIYLDENVDMLIRTDGSIWLYDLKNGLTKITKSTPEKEDEKLIIEFENVLERQGVISNINSEMTIDDLKTKIKTNGNIKVYTKDGVLIEKNEKLATGMKVEISLGNEKVFYTIAIEGDCNGDGKVRVGDLTTMMVSVAENLASNKDTSKILDGAWKQAVDFNGDGKLNVSDITKLKILIAESK